MCTLLGRLTCPLLGDHNGAYYHQQPKSTRLYKALFNIISNICCCNSIVTSYTALFTIMYSIQYPIMLFSPLQLRSAPGPRQHLVRPCPAPVFRSLLGAHTHTHRRENKKDSHVKDEICSFKYNLDTNKGVCLIPVEAQAKY